MSQLATPLIPKTKNLRQRWTKPDTYVYGVAVLVLMVMGCARAWCVTPDPSACGYSDQVYYGDSSIMRGNPPTHFRLMTSRYVQMNQAARGYHCTGTVTIGFTGHNYVQGGMTDDPGLSWLIPTISSLSGLSLANTFDLVEFAVIVSGLLIGFGGFWQLHPDWRARWVGAGVFFCLGLAQAKLADVYIFQTAPLIAGIPWVLHFGLGRRPVALNLSAALLAFACSWCSLMRIGTSLICLAFLITLFIARRRVQNVFLSLTLVALACGPAAIFKDYMIARRNAILASLGATAPAVNQHTVWHSIYIGFAFVPNSEVPVYEDSVGMKKVRSIDPEVPNATPRYEAILRGAVFDLAKRRPMLVIGNLVAKVGVLILLAAILLFPSRRFLFADRQVLWMDAGFVAAMGMSAMNAILVIPIFVYLLTFLCLTLLYSCVKLCGGRFMPTEGRLAVA
jgi:hypothetical protein